MTSGMIIVAITLIAVMLGLGLTYFYKTSFKGGNATHSQFKLISLEDPTNETCSEEDDDYSDD